jgi:MOSC domain-containing protein YiiM
MITIESIQIGKVVTEGDADAREVTDKQWTSAFRKTPITVSVRVDSLGIEGDQVADTKHHGGAEKSILCYASAHYAAWREEHPELDFAPGGFGENLTLAGATEADVCIGDRWSAGECVFEVSQPRQPCWKIARRWQTKTMTKEVTQTGRTGWYLRVLCGGELTAGDTLTLTSRPHPEWSVARANDVLFGREVDRLAVFALMNLAELSDEWKQSIG